MKEKIQEYLNVGINSRKNALKNEIDVKQDNQCIGLMVTGAVIVSGLSSIVLNPTIGLTVAGIAAAVVPLKVRNYLKLDVRENRIKDEIKHSEELINGIEEDNIDLKREKKVELISLDNSRRLANEKYTTSKKITFISYGLTAVGIGAIILNPTYAVAVIPGLIANTLAVSNEVKKYASCESIKKRINNIHHEIEVIDIQNGNVSTSKELNQKDQTDFKKNHEESIDTLLNYFEEKPYQEEKSKEYQKTK